MSHAAAATALIAIVVMVAIALAYELLTRDPREPGEPRRQPHPAGPGRHVRAAFADPRDVSDPDGSVWLRSLRHEVPQSSLAELVRASGLPAPGAFPMLPPDPPPAETGPLPVAVCELGMSVEDYVEHLFARAAEELGRAA